MKNNIKKSEDNKPLGQKVFRFFLYTFADFLERLCSALDRGQLEPLYFKISVKLFRTHCIFADWSYLLDEKYKLGLWKTTNE